MSDVEPPVGLGPLSLATVISHVTVLNIDSRMPKVNTTDTLISSLSLTKADIPNKIIRESVRGGTG